MGGLHHLSFVRNLAMQYEWPVLMWQINPDFPARGTGRDARFTTLAVGVLLYFMPAAPIGKNNVGSALLD